MRTRLLASLIVGIACSSSFGQVSKAQDAYKPIFLSLRSLRGLSDSDRPDATKQLALDIRALPSGLRKIQVANALANLSTEGDFGQSTLQEVTTTLSKAVEEAGTSVPPASIKGVLMELAQLEKFEHVTVGLNTFAYQAAKADLEKLETARKKVDFTLKDISGQSWTLSSLKGKIVVVNFWATWCPPCRKEMPDLQALYAKYKEAGLVVLAISDEKDAVVKDFIAKSGYSYPILLDSKKKVGAAYSIEGIPHTFIYDRTGKLAAEAIDMRTRGQFQRLLAKAGLM
jgi:peroxiredoxin